MFTAFTNERMAQRLPARFAQKARRATASLEACSTRIVELATKLQSLGIDFDGPLTVSHLLRAEGLESQWSNALRARAEKVRLIG